VGGSENSHHRLRTVPAFPTTPSPKRGVTLAFHGVSFTFVKLYGASSRHWAFIDTVLLQRWTACSNTSLLYRTYRDYTVRENCSGWSQCTTATRFEQRAAKDKQQLGLCRENLAPTVPPRNVGSIGERFAHKQPRWSREQGTEQRLTLGPSSDIRVHTEKNREMIIDLVLEQVRMVCGHRNCKRPRTNNQSELLLI